MLVVIITSASENPVHWLLRMFVCLQCEALGQSGMTTVNMEIQPSGHCCYIFCLRCVGVVMVVVVGGVGKVKSREYGWGDWVVHTCSSISHLSQVGGCGQGCGQ